MSDEEFLKCFKGVDEGQTRPIQTEKHYFVLLLGNGFDLQCGLRTRYNDFFEHSLKEIKDDDRIYKIVQDELDNNAQEKDYNLEKIEQLYNKHSKYLSVWDVYFIHSNVHCENWVDVEKLMKKSLVDEKFWDGVSFNFNQIISGNINIDDMRKRNNNLYSLLAILIYDRYFTENGKFLGVEPGPDNDAIFYEKLVKELEVFEQRFGDYINEQYESNKEAYIRVSRENISRIFKDAITNFGYKTSSCFLRIVSFNYLPLLDEDLNEDRKYVHYIHSDIYNPIFCIDKISEKENERAVYYNYFSNEKREVNLGVYSLDTILPKQENYEFNILSYGLSFSDVDADDFKRLMVQSTFDNNNGRIGSKIRIYRRMIAYYPDNGNSKKENIRKTRENKVETTNNLRNIVQKIDSDTSFTSLINGNKATIQINPIKLISMSDKSIEN